MRWLHVVVSAALVTLLALPGAAAESDTPFHVRGLSRESRDLVTRAARESAIVRGLVEALDRTDVVVYVTLDAVERPSSTGRLAFMAAAGGLRYVMVKIDWLAIPRHRIAILGHELQHALEVAGAPGVHDRDTFAMLYARIGFETGSGKYETDLARLTGRRIELELAGLRTLM